MADPDKTVVASGPIKPLRAPALDKFLKSLSVEPQDLSSDNLLSGSPRADVASLSVPAIGGIPIFARIGRGGMGTVYYGVHPRLKKEVAIKILTIDVQESPDSVDRFFREAQIAANLQSPNLVSVLDVNEENNLFFIVMEYVSGISAGAFVKQVMAAGEPGLDEISALDICIAASEGLSAAHEAGIIHRDIKPDNIMLPYDKNGHLALSKAKLADLGLARSQSGNSYQSHSSESVCGTLGYMSPEQTRSSRLTKKPSDVFSMAATLYALLTGRPPFTGGSAVEIILATVQSFPKPITKYRSDISGETLALIERCLSKTDTDRPADAAELVLALRECRTALAQPKRDSAVIQRTVIAAQIKPKPDLDQDTILRTFKYTTPPAEKQARTKAAAATTQPPTMKMPSAQTRPVTTRKPAEKNMTGVLSLAALALLVLGVGGYLVFGGGGKKEEPKVAAAAEVKKAAEKVETPSGVQPDSIMPMSPVDKPTVDEAWISRVSALRGIDQEREFRKKIQELNPKSDISKIKITYEAGQIVEIDCGFDTNIFLTEISPVAALKALKALRIARTSVSNLKSLNGLPLEYLGMNSTLITTLDVLRTLPMLKRLSISSCNKLKYFEPLRGLKLTKLEIGENTDFKDLEVLRGMPLEELTLSGTLIRNFDSLIGSNLNKLEFSNSQVADFSALKKVPLRELDLSRSQISDLNDLKDLNLSLLSLSECKKIKDLTPLKTMKSLKHLYIIDTSVTDLTPLTELKLESLAFTPNRIKSGIQEIRAMSSIIKLSSKSFVWEPAEKFWAEYDRNAGALPESKNNVATGEVLLREDFEKFDLNNLPEDWKIEGHLEDMTIVSAADVRSKVLRVNNTKSTFLSPTIAKVLDLEKVRGKTLRFSVNAKCEKSFTSILGTPFKSPGLMIYVGVDGITDFRNTRSANLTEDDRDWKRLTITKQIPNNVTRCKVLLGIQSNKADVIFDDLTVEIVPDGQINPELEKVKPTVAGLLLLREDFEKFDLKNLPEEWKMEGRQGDISIFPTGDGHGNVLRINNTNSTYLSPNISKMLDIEKVRGKTVRFSVNARCEKPFIPNLEFPFKCPNLSSNSMVDGQLDHRTTKPATLNPDDRDWKRLSLIKQIPINATSCNVVLMITSNKANVVFDDLTVEILPDDKVNAIPNAQNPPVADVTKPAPSGTILVNEDFESLDLNKLPAGWKTYSQDVSITTLPEHGKVLRILRDQPKDTAAQLKVGLDINQVRGKTIRASIMAYCPNGYVPSGKGSSPSLSLFALGMKENRPFFNGTNMLKGNKWTKLYLQYTVPETATSIDILPGIIDGTGEIFFDDLKIEIVP